MSQVIRDPRVPVHFCNKVRGKAEKSKRRWKQGAERGTAAEEVMQQQKAVRQCSGTDREEERGESGSVREMQRRGREGRE